ncbi:MAG: FG-GAP repeat domain-containing protein, partial [Limisphaerales bacterium]
LPRDAQFTPVFGIAVADFDSDGFQDLALAQNLFGTREQDGPLDAGRGLMLLGSAGGNMTALSGMQSGVIAYGEQRGIAAIDFDKDGRPDLAIGQNGTETKLFRNTHDQNGTRRAEAK